MAHHRSSPAYHQERHPERGFHLFDDHVRRNHAEGVGEEEDRKRDIVVVSRHMQCLGHAGDFGIANCGPISNQLKSKALLQSILLDLSRNDSRYSTASNVGSR